MPTNCVDTYLNLEGVELKEFTKTAVAIIMSEYGYSLEEAIQFILEWG